MANYATHHTHGDPLAPGWTKDSLTSVKSPSGAEFRVHKDAAPAFSGFLAELEGTGYKVNSSGGFNHRNVRGGSRLSPLGTDPTQPVNSHSPAGHQLRRGQPQDNMEFRIPVKASLTAAIDRQAVQLGLKIEAADFRHVDLVATDLRWDDARTARSVSGQPDARIPLAEGLRMSTAAWVICGAGGVPIVMFGVMASPVRSDLGFVWMVASNEFPRHGRRFLRASLAVLKALHQSFETLVATSDCRSRVHHRWLKWCGFVSERRLAAAETGSIPMYLFTKVRTQ